jgi:hypothetical protein
MYCNGLNRDVNLLSGALLADLSGGILELMLSSPSRQTMVEAVKLISPYLPYRMNLLLSSGQIK